MHRCELVVKDMIPGKKIDWTVIDNYFGFTKDKTEWKGSEIVFEIARQGDKTEVKGRLPLRLSCAGWPDNDCQWKLPIH